MVLTVGKSLRKLHLYTRKIQVTVKSFYPVCLAQRYEPEEYKESNSPIYSQVLQHCPVGAPLLFKGMLMCSQYQATGESHVIAFKTLKFREYLLSASVLTSELPSSFGMFVRIINQCCR